MPETTASQLQANPTPDAPAPRLQDLLAAAQPGETISVPPGCHAGMTFQAPMQGGHGTPAAELLRQQAQRAALQAAAEAEAARVQEEKEYGADDPDSDLAVR